MGPSKKAIAKNKDRSSLDKIESENAEYLRAKYFSGKDSFGEDVYEETVIIGGENIKSSRSSPTKSYADPVAYQKEVAEVKKKLLAEKVSAEESRPCPARLCGELVRVQDEGDESSDSVQEISADDWYEIQSALKRAKSGAGPSKKRH